MVFDTGMASVNAAMALREHFGRVLVFVPWVSSFPTSNLREIGQGIPGIERVDYFFDHVDEVDLFVCLDVNMGDVQKHLRKLGHAVWGSMKGDELELFRWTAKEYQKNVGLPVQPVRLIVGLDNLRVYLQQNEDKYIKYSQTRGDDESWHHTTYLHSKSRLNDLQHRLGPFADIYEFIVEDPIPKAGEYGYDGINIRGKYPPTACFGYEKKDEGYCGVALPYSKLPKGAIEVNAKLAPLFEGYGYSGFYSSEIREKDKKPHLIDNTCRIPSPPGETYWKWIKNMAQVLWAGANGEVVDIEPIKPYVFEYILYSEQAARDPLAVEYPKEIEPYVALYNRTRVKGVDWIVPTDAHLVQIGGVFGFGDTIEEAQKQAKEHLDQVKADGLEVKDDAPAKIYETLKKAKKEGIYFGESPIP